MLPLKTRAMPTISSCPPSPHPPSPERDARGVVAARARAMPQTPYDAEKERIAQDRKEKAQRDVLRARAAARAAEKKVAAMRTRGANKSNDNADADADANTSPRSARRIRDDASASAWGLAPAAWNAAGGEVVDLTSEVLSLRREQARWERERTERVDREDAMAKEIERTSKANEELEGAIDSPVKLVVNLPGVGAAGGLENVPPGGTAQISSGEEPSEPQPGLHPGLPQTVEPPPRVLVSVTANEGHVASVVTEMRLLRREMRAERERAFQAEARFVFARSH